MLSNETLLGYRTFDDDNHHKPVAMSDDIELDQPAKDEDFETIAKPHHPKIGFRYLYLVDGYRNIPLLIMIPLTVLFTGMWQVGNPEVYDILGVHLDIQDIVRDVLLYCIGLMSLILTPDSTRALNDFSWAPIAEVAKLFFGIFITIIPAVAILKAGKDGDLHMINSITSNSDGTPIDLAYFWLCGLLSSCLDNAPTFLIFFNMAGGDADHLSTEMWKTLLAISCGSVFLGACTYIGNAPNFMVKSIVETSGFQMPSFGMYIVWVMFTLMPILVFTSFLFFG